MTLQHYSVVSGDSFYAIARKIAPKATGPDLDKVLNLLTSSNGLTLLTPLHPNRVLFYDDAKIPAVNSPNPTPHPTPNPNPNPG